MRVLVGVLTLVASVAALAGGGAPAPTFYGQVDKILRRHCDECHRAGDIAGTAYDDFETAQRWAPNMVESIEAGRMPPWRPTRGIGRFVGERGVTARELDTLRRWRDAGAPEGRRPTKSRPIVVPDGWILGEPDEVLDYGEPFTMAAGGDDVYRCFPIRNPFGRDVWLSGIDVRPGDRRVLHHVVLYVDSSGAALSLDAADPGPGYACFGGPGTASPSGLGGWAPGNRPRFFRPGTAMFLGANDTVVLQCHYHSSDVDVSDHTVVGLHESTETNPTPIVLLPVLNDTFTIPAGDPAYPVEALLDPSTLTGGFIKISGNILAVMPHMHWLGKSIVVDLLLPDGTEQRLVEIRDWSFDWQDTYTFAEPIPVPPGAKVRLRAVYDNSAANPHNPNSPPMDVSYGERTTDEMCLAFLEVTLGPATASAPPTIRSVVVDKAGRFVVAARNLGRGGRIEVDGAPLADSVSVGANRLRSAADWAGAVAPQGATTIRVRRSDGRLSPPYSIVR